MSMRVRREPTTGPAISTDDVFRVAELHRLAEDWSKEPMFFTATKLTRYQELATYYGIDGTSLLFATQNRNSPADQTSIMPTVGETPGDGFSETEQ